jgi:hypothetical protein
MMFRRRQLRRDEQGVAVIEMAFALPILIVMIWIFVQLAQVYRAVAGIQQALGEGARYATLCLSPTNSGCTAPTGDQIKTVINNSVYGIGPGTFTDTIADDSGHQPIFRPDRQLHPAHEHAAVPWSDNHRQPLEASVDRRELISRILACASRRRR